MNGERMSVLIVTPVRDEERYIETTLRCMCAQTVLPDRWVIVNDGSRDRTGEIIRSWAASRPFIQYVERDDRGHRMPGAGVVEAFYTGLSQVDWRRFDIVSKFDGDLEFDPDTIEKIVLEFEADPRAGIVGGVRYERRESGGPFRKVIVSKEHVGGPYKFYRRACFEEIGGLVRRAGWDGVDNIRANLRGWSTGERDHIRFMHLRPTGTAVGEGLSRAGMKYGDVAYYMGGYFWYFLLRAAGLSAAQRRPVMAVHMLKGYFTSAFRREERESPEFRKMMRRMQLDNVLYRMGLVLSRPGVRKAIDGRS